MHQRYVARFGDTVVSVAKNHNITVEELIKANRLMQPYILRPGMELLIPPRREQTNFFPYEVKSGDTLYSIAQRYKVKPEIIALANGIDLNQYIYPKQILLIPKEGVRVYVTKDGDTIDDVAKMLNTTINKLLLDNKKIYLLEEQLIMHREK